MWTGRNGGDDQLLQKAASAVADGVADLGTLMYEELWPGVDLVYTGTANWLKHYFLVKPGADPRQIRLAYRGATSAKRNDEGSQF